MVVLEYMTLKHIKIFISVCDTGSMTAASKELFIAQPAVSFAIAELENYYGQKLFDRISNRLYITEAGKMLLTRSRQIANLFDDMETAIRNWENSDILRIGCDVSIGDRTLPKLIQTLQSQHPKVNIQVSMQNAPSIEQMILDGTLDVALIEGPIMSKLISSQKIGEHNLIFICPKDHPWADSVIDVAQLNNCNFVVREKESMERRLLDKFLRAHKVKVNLVWQSVIPNSVMNAVASGFGIAAVSSLSASDFLEKGLISQFQVKDISPLRESFVIYHPNKILTDVILDFVSLCRKEVL